MFEQTGIFEFDEIRALDFSLFDSDRHSSKEPSSSTLSPSDSSSSDFHIHEDHLGTHHTTTAFVQRAKYSTEDVQAIIDDGKDPRGKFLRDTCTSAATVLELNLMPLLDKVPRTVRRKYGKRNKLSEEDKAELSRQRNREHSKATRDRKRLFEEIDRLKSNLLQQRKRGCQSFALTMGRPETLHG